MPDSPLTVKHVLAEVVEELGGQERPGQIQMAEAVGRAMSSGEHLLVQAGTGTGKSLGYLVPALLHDRRVVVATATLALQHQLVERDIPALVEAAGDELGDKASYAVLKGRGNYACLHRIREGVPDDQGVLVDVPEGSMASEVLALRSWAEEESERGGPGDRDSAPKHTDRVWRQVSVNHRECLGASRCPYALECFAERAKERAAQSQLVVTNHSLLAIDAIEGVPMIPEYDVVVIDEAHELSSRVTQAATDELSVPEIERAARRSQKHVDGAEADELADAADMLRDALDETDPGRIDSLPVALSDALNLVRDSARALISAFPKESGGSDGGDGDAGRTQAKGWVQEIFKTAERMAANLESDVLWLSDRDPSRGGSRLHVAPLQVWGPLRDKLLHDKTVVFTSATLMLGGDFNSVATSIGLKPSERVDHSIDAPAEGSAGDAASGSVPDAAEADDESLPWRGIDVGSPFDYPRQGILYVARHLPPPGRDGLGAPQIDEIADLVDAAEGRTLGSVLEPSGSRGGGRGAARAAAAPDCPGAGGSAAARARPSLRGGPARLSVRDAEPVAGARRPGGDLPARRHRPDPVPPPRRPAHVREAARCGQGRWQRVHVGGRHPRRAAPGPGRRPADPYDGRPRGRRHPRPPARDGALRRLPPRVTAYDVAHHGPSGRPRRAQTAGEVRLGDPSDERRQPEAP